MTAATRIDARRIGRIDIRAGHVVFTDCDIESMFVFEGGPEPGDPLESAMAAVAALTRTGDLDALERIRRALPAVRDLRRD